MGAQLRVARRRIRSVQSTQKLTRAQELIATSRIAKAQAQVEQARPYTRQITAVIESLLSAYGGDAEVSQPLLEERANPDKVAVLVLTSDRGWAGAYAANVLRTTEELLARLREEGKDPQLYVVGRKGVAYYRFRERPMANTWTGFTEQPKFVDVEPVARHLIEEFATHRVDEIHVVYTDFVSLVTQRAAAYRILPVVVEEVPRGERVIPQYDFEPDPQRVLDELLPRYVVSRIFTAVLEAAASESASRRRAMQAATDNADELIKNLTREANQARQAEITQEIMEIVGGAEALRQTGSE